MARVKTVVFLLFLSVVSSSCDLFDGFSGGHIEGKVINALSGEPIDDVVVIAETGDKQNKKSDKNSGRRSGKTDSRGMFTIKGLSPEHSYHVRVRQEGYTSAPRQIPRVVKGETTEIEPIHVYKFHENRPIKKSGWIAPVIDGGQPFEKSGDKKYLIWKSGFSSCRMYVDKKDAAILNKRGKYFNLSWVGSEKYAAFMPENDRYYTGELLEIQSITPMEQDGMGCESLSDGSRECGPLLRVFYLYYEPIP